MTGSRTKEEEGMEEMTGVGERGSVGEGGEGIVEKLVEEEEGD